MLIVALLVVGKFPTLIPSLFLSSEKNKTTIVSIELEHLLISIQKRDNALLLMSINFSLIIIRSDVERAKQ